MAGLMKSNPMTPKEAMEVEIREIGGYRGAAIERAVYGAIGAATALANVGLISLDDAADWRAAAQKAGEAQREAVAKRAIEKRRKAFPDRVALQNPIAHYFNMNFAREIQICEKHSIKDGDEPLKVLDFKAVLSVDEAILLFRPYIRLLNGRLQGKVSFKYLLDCGFQVSDDDVTLVREASIERMCIWRMEDPIMDMPLEEIQGFPRRSSYFEALVWREDGYPDHEKIHGLFAPNESVVQGWIKDVRCMKAEPCEIEVGMLAAVYTAKGNKGLDTCASFVPGGKPSSCRQYPSPFCSACGHTFCEPCWGAHKLACSHDTEAGATC